MRIILFSPEIPQNVGNIARTCAVTGVELALVRPLQFNLSDRQMKRAGLDYWDQVKLEVADSLEPFLEKEPFYFFSTRGKSLYTDIAYEGNANLIFGSETAGLPKWVHEKWPHRLRKIPMRPHARSLNLSNSVAVVLYEALRQQNFTMLR